MKPTHDFLAFLAANVPACPAVRWSICPRTRLLQVHCTAPASLQAACGYPIGTCPHRGPYRDVDEAQEELDLCLIRQTR